MSGDFLLDGRVVPFEPGQTILQAASAQGAFIPHLCWDPRFAAHGSCRLCVVRVGGRPVPACATAAQEGMRVESDTPDLNAERGALLEMLFVEGNHFCPACEKSGDCRLQALAYRLGMTDARFAQFYPDRPVDASHPELLIDFNRCIFCELCVRASREVDGKCVFALGGRGLRKHLVVNAVSGRLADTDLSATDLAANICPVGAILHKGVGFATPIGRRTYDLQPMSESAREPEK